MESTTASHTSRFPASPESPGRARGMAARILEAAGTSGQSIELAKLLVSEVVTNAVVHSASPVEVRVDTRPPIRVEVSDESPALPEPIETPVHEPGGLGLVLLSSLADRWGATPVPDGGKVVWFEVRG